MTMPMNSLTDTLTEICGEGRVILDAEERAFYSQDLFDLGCEPLAVVRPGSTEAVAEVVRFAKAQGMPLFVRGGGMSYTRAFLPSSEGGLVVDTSGLDSIDEINVEDGYVTVGAGCSWKALDAALEAHGVRTTFWGPFSGARATVGGSISQGSATFGSGQTGTTAPAVLGMDIVTGAGEVLRSGMDAQDGPQSVLPALRPRPHGAVHARRRRPGYQDPHNAAARRAPELLWGRVFFLCGF
jgi:FAD/FMN-containing dehydrogenase